MTQNLESNNIFLNFDKILSYNSYLNIILGERGVGKSYGAKRYVFKHFLKTGKKFVYVRRYSRELKKATMKGKEGIFFNQIKNEKITQGHEFYNNYETCYIDKKPCGYFTTLSTSLIEKSADFSDVDTIIFDEFLIPKGSYHYIPNEVYIFLEFIESVGRLKNDMKIFMIGNAITEVNPYFTELGIKIPYNSEFKSFKNGLITFWYVKNLEYRKVKKKSNFGKLVENTKYGEYAIDNKFLQDSKTFIKKKSKNAKYLFTICMVNNMYGVYADYDLRELYVSSKVNKNHPLKVTLNYEAHSENNLYIRKRGNLLLKNLIDSYYSSSLFFENQQIKTTVLNDLVRYLT